MNAETRLMQLIRLEAGTVPGVRIFRNNVGLFYTRQGTPIRCGLFKGSSDQIGWRTVTVTPAMVGRRVALFVSLEAKGLRSVVEPDQQHWIDQVRAAGGLAGAAWTPEQAREILCGR
ncbi:MAG: VRR-NUC domain-containing protein [Elusimicrobia bacterium]|nr:VRR-NUC domain-containing protein [Elusimicrobiota bacterium]